MRVSFSSFSLLNHPCFWYPNFRRLWWAPNFWNFCEHIIFLHPGEKDRESISPTSPLLLLIGSHHFFFLFWYHFPSICQKPKLVFLKVNVRTVNEKKKKKGIRRVKNVWNSELRWSELAPKSNPLD